MREIKFRAWRGEHGMSEPFTLQESERFINPFWDITYLEYSGLEDKNGKEIYEGDIVKYQSNGKEIVDTVIYLDSFFGVEKFTGILVYFYPIEIIGNIYQNPELLK